MCTLIMSHLFYSLTNIEKFTFPNYLGDTRPEFRMWGGASKSLFVLVLKICQHQFASKTLSC